MQNLTAQQLLATTRLSRLKCCPGVFKHRGGQTHFKNLHFKVLKSRSILCRVLLFLLQIQPVKNLGGTFDASLNFIKSHINIIISNTVRCRNSHSQFPSNGAKSKMELQEFIV